MNALEPVLAGGGGSLESEPLPPIPVPEIPEFDPAACVRGECAATGLWFTAHPLDVLAAPAPDAIAAASVGDRVGRRIAVVGMPCAYRRVETKSGELLLFLTVADRSGLAECVLLPDVYRAQAGAVHGQIVQVEGRVEEKLGSITVRVEKVKPVA